MVFTSFGVRLKVGNKGVRGVKDNGQVSDLSNWRYCDYLANMLYPKKYDDPLRILKSRKPRTN